MKKHIFISTWLALLVIASVAPASAFAQELAEIVETYGKNRVASYLKREGDGRMYAQDQDGYIKLLPRPSNDLITPATIRMDLERLGISAPELGEALAVEIPSEPSRTKPPTLAQDNDEKCSEERVGLCPEVVAAMGVSELLDAFNDDPAASILSESILPICANADVGEIEARTQLNALLIQARKHTLEGKPGKALTIYHALANCGHYGAIARLPHIMRAVDSSKVDPERHLINHFDAMQQDLLDAASKWSKTAYAAMRTREIEDKRRQAQRIEDKRRQTKRPESYDMNSREHKEYTKKMLKAWEQQYLRQ